MKKKNKVISLIVVLSLCFSFTVIPANAVNPYAVVRPPDVGGGGETSDPYEGQFFIQNCESQTFMQIDDNASYSEQSAKMELWPFDGTSIQGWEITNLDNGYYKIVSIKSGLALSVQSGKENSGNVALVQQTYSGAYRQQWTIESGTVSGAVIIKPRSAESYSTDWRMAMGNGAFTYDGRNVEQRSSQSGNGDEWYLHVASNYAHITLPVRIYYDSSIVQRSSVSQLEEKFEQATEEYLRVFHIDFDITLISISNLLELVTEGCDTAHAPDTMCTAFCGDLELCNTLHHKGASRLKNSCHVSSQYYTMRMVGYAICYYSPENSHRPIGGLATLNGKDTIVSAMYTDSPFNTIIQHELAHNLGVEHCQSSNCIMNGSNNLNALCNVCKTTLREFYQ